MRTLATIAFSASGALLLAALLPQGAWSLFLAAGLLLLGGLSLWLLKEKQRLRIYAALIAFSAAAGLLYSAGYQRVLVAPVLSRCGEDAVLTVQVADYPQARENGWRVTVRPDGWRVNACLYTVTEDAGQLEPGQRITCTVHIQDASTIGGDEVTTFTARGVFALLYDREEGFSVEEGQAGSLRYFPLRLRQAILEKIPAVWQNRRTAGLLRAELLGDKSGLTDAEQNQVSEVGLSHLFAVSGLHCAFLVSLLALLIPAGRRRLLAGCSIPILLIYMVAVGLTPSVVRACIMLIFLLLAPLFRRATDPLTSLSAALLVILLGNPYAAASVSLQLSFGATLGLLVVSPRLQAAFSRRCRGQRPAVRKAWLFLGANLSATLGAMVFTTPLTAYYFGLLTPLSPLSNLLAVPLAGWSFMAAFLTLPVGFLYLPAAQVLGLLARGADGGVLVACAPDAALAGPCAVSVQPLPCLLAGTRISDGTCVRAFTAAETKVCTGAGAERCDAAGGGGTAYIRLPRRAFDGGGSGCGAGRERGAFLRRTHHGGGLRKQQQLQAACPAGAGTVEHHGRAAAGCGCGDPLSRRPYQRPV